MNLSAIKFNVNAARDYWSSINLSKGLAVLPMHAEKWYLIKRQGDWDGILKKVDIFVADGVGLSWGYRFLTGKSVVKVSGVDLIEQLVQDQPKTATYIWGTTPENIKKAAQAYKRRGLNVTGFHDGFSGTKEEVFAEIEKVKPQIVFVGMGARKAAELIIEIKEELGISAMTAGGSFDVAGGEFKRAPLFFQKVGLEWFWRMLADPKRFKRLPAILGFMYYVVKEKLKA